MKRYLKVIFILCLLFISLTVTADGNNLVYFGPQWEKGDTTTYQITKTITTNNIKQQDISSKFAVEVLEKNEDGYVLQWTNYDYSSEKDNNATLNNKIMQITSNIDIQYKTDIYGSFQEFINMSEIKEKLKKTADTAAENMSQQEKKIFENIIKTVFKTDNQINMLLSRDINILHYPSFYFYEYEIDSRYEGGVSIPNPWGGDNLPGVIDITADKKKDGLNIVKVNQELDQNQATALVKEVVDEMLSQSGIKAPADEFVDEFVITDDYRCKFRDGDNWLQEAEHVREISVGIVTRKDTVKIVKID
ncbi:MAG: hypothetical protein ACOCRZ_02000 [Halothermotrichaceae bacterium]